MEKEEILERLKEIKDLLYEQGYSEHLAIDCIIEGVENLADVSKE